MECYTQRSEYLRISTAFKSEFSNATFSWVRAPTSSTNLKVFHCINANETHAIKFIRHTEVTF